MLESTESYLKSLIAETAISLNTDFDSSTPFGELGIDSFLVLKIVKALEADFGTLPKTLLFENFNVEALARYFVDEHSQSLAAKFSTAPQSARPIPVETPATPADAVTENASVQGVAVKSPRSLPLVQPPTPTPSPVRKTPIRLFEKDLPKHPELNELCNDLFERYKNEGSVSRGTRHIAPNLFIGSERRGFFNYGRTKNIVLVYAYTGCKDYFLDIAREMYQYCVAQGFQLNIFADEVIESIAEVSFSCTPFGALQRVLDIQDFTLQGGAMRRLRYQVSKFEKFGVCRTQEYKCGTDKEVDKNIAEIIDQWCATKTMVNPLIHVVKEEILAGTLQPQHRIFLTYVDDVLQNVILISAMCRELNGYLMDLEFYLQSAFPGGLEYAIVNIIGTLVAEGCDMLSLGGTYGCRLDASPNADPEVDRILDDLHKQNIFNDEGNLQFKNKFRPENKTIYLCRPVGSGNADNVIDIIMMIADPSKAQITEEENHNAVGDRTSTRVMTEANQPVIESEARSHTLLEFGFNPFNIPSDQIEFDLKTDSWAQLDASFVTKQMRHLHAQLQQSVNVNDSLQQIFPFKYFVLTNAGRTADHVFCKAWPKKGLVPQNLLFPTCIYHQIDKGFTPLELPHPALFQSGLDATDKSHLSWDALQEQVAKRASEIAYVCIEVSDNAAGGHPVSIRHLRQVKELLTDYSIPLVIDGTRILENARFLLEHEKEYSGKTTWDLAREILSYADVVTGSLAKDFCVNKGGLIATNDETLLSRLQDVIRQEGGGLNIVEKKLIALSLQNRKQLDAWVKLRMQAVDLIWQALKAQNVPIAEPAGGHCVLIDVKRMTEFANFEHPVASFLAWLYLNTGIRAGAHSVGMQKNTVINDRVRLAIPVGMKLAQIEDIRDRLVCLFKEKKNIPELALCEKASESFADIHANYELVRYHRAAGATFSVAEAPTTTAATTPAATETPVDAITSLPALEPTESIPTAPATTPTCQDIAVIGMAGRYPKARNLNEFWQNLREGRDCVENIPQERITQRIERELTQRYRGGFLEDVDKFDSLFFNISPREAEVLDPQERLFLEVAWETLEDAGYFPEILAQEEARRDVGVFVGAVWAMYQILGVEEKLAGNDVNPNSFLWSIANRVSYWMNFTGPSLTVDTACSSSLTTIYLACEAIHNGRCSSAIVGGVNLDLHQHKFDINHAGGALSSDGVCRSFGAGANGYVAGEGVGAVFIKPLTKALEDKDNIYGVIKSAVVNHGGRTSGYTVPNPQAQGNLIADALEKAAVDARSIDYIEAHGTGTELGDPIEISGLTNAFKPYEVGNQTCPIGSVKTNIGHLEAAAGVAGVCKVLLQMKHRQLVPSLHSTQLNEYIDFDNSPFYVQQSLEAWNAKDIHGVNSPLRAGISSFGAGGANAHLIVESHELPAVESPARSSAHVFPLSARNDKQLRAMVTRLRQHLELDFVQHDLNDIAFTLQNGRKSFEHRLVIIAENEKELISKLNLFLEGKQDADVLFGHAKNSEGITSLLSRKEKEQFIGLLSASRDPHKLAQLWIDGLLADCSGFPQTGGRRTSLPTYPFADKRHWIRKRKATTEPPTSSLPARSGIHPLIDSNESTFKRQLFRKTFHGQEFFLRDHLVSDVPTLPGTAYLDLARKAGEIAAGRKVQKIKNVTWVSPLAVEGSAATDALIELKPSADSVFFEVFSESAGEQKKLYAQGRLIYENEHTTESEPEYIDLAGIRARCSKTITGQEAYPLFKSVGLNYGPSFQVLQEVHKNEDEVLGLLKLPEVRNADFDRFMLHPCLLDASMQAGIVAQLNEAAGAMKIPYSIGEVEVLYPLTRTCYSHVKRVGGDGKQSSEVSKEDVTIVDESGKILARIRESIGVPLMTGHNGSAPIQSKDEFDELNYFHVWQKASLANGSSDVEAMLIFDMDDRLYNACIARNLPAILVLPGDKFAQPGKNTYRIDPQDSNDYVRLLDDLTRRNWAVEKVCYAWSDPSDPSDEGELRRALAKGVYSFLFFCQALTSRQSARKFQILYLYFGKPGTIQPHNEAINGFTRSLHLENPKIDCKVLEIRQDKIDPNAVLGMALAELHVNAQDDSSIRYDDGIRYARTLQKLDHSQLEEAQPPGIALKHHGVYLITGGAGGLGLIFAEYLADQCQARLVLTGRSRLSPEREAQIEDLKKMGAEVLYITADISKSDDVQRLLQQSKSRFGNINGIIHSAGVLRDSLLKKKTAEEMGAVFAPKVFGTFHLDKQTREENLDFFVTFSSLAAVGGNIGQCDYSFANHYMDSFAAHREMLRTSAKRAGRSLSLNWSLWAEGGMKLDEQTEIFFKKNLGINPLNKALGLGAFVKALPLDQPQIAVLEGVQTKIEQAWGLNKKKAAPAPASVQDVRVATDAEDISSLVMRELSDTVMELLKLNVEDLSPDSILVDLGFDSIGLTTFANAINDKYQLDINPTLFFEYPSIRTIASVLATEHRSAVLRANNGGKPPVVARAQTAPTQPVAAPALLESEAHARFAIDKNWEPSKLAAHNGDFSREHRFLDVPIAIVGIAGVMPQSENLDVFWKHLKNAHNLVTEIPRDRWIWEEYDGNPVKEVNKSNSKWGGFIKDVDKFDPLFFGITPREAQMMDPQQRIFLETVWSAIEDSGHRVSDLSGTKTGLFVGVSAKDYIDVIADHQSALDGFSASGNSHSTLANRVSFLLNLRGPSAPLDTACSSSLVALHRAIESIHTGSSDMAIVGGVQVMLTPIAHISLSSAGMLSVDGKCKTFDKDANGYVRGEGAGAIFIKPLVQAEEDGNPIYAVIKATAENHGGRVTMLTAPNPKAQAELLFEAYTKAQVDPTSVGYVECHGTGTSLGDPIEIQALKKSFSDLYTKHHKAPPETPHCGLSSVKTNIGHLEPAAGIASLLKVLLAIQHKQIPAMLHFETLNPYIDLDGSPFYIVDKTTPWEVMRGPDGAPLPRRAGVSSFGWGGANAHVVLEEYLPPQRHDLDQAQGPRPIILSAKNEDRLNAYARSLLAHIQEHDIEFVDLAYTLQIGRDPMEERLGMIVDSIEQLVEKLNAIVAGEQNSEAIYRGRVRRFKRDEQGLSVIESNDKHDLQAKDIDAWIANRNYPELLAAWVKGTDVDWAKLQAADSNYVKAKRVSLPTYPFARERHWIDSSGKKNAVQSDTAAVLHPLLHTNTSILGRQSYSTTFSGKEFFLIDHEGNIPAMAFLEMARAAIVEAKPIQKNMSVLIHHTRWASPTIIRKKKSFVINLHHSSINGQVDYEIHGFDAIEDSQHHDVIQCQGSVTIENLPATANLDVHQIEALMKYGQIDIDRVDAMLKQLVPHRGTTLRAINAIYKGYQQLLIHLELPPSVKKSNQEYVLHPTIMDSALQAAIALVTDFEHVPDHSLSPSEIESLQVFSPCTEKMYAWVRYSRSSEANNHVIRLDIDITDDNGTVCVKIKSLTFNEDSFHRKTKIQDDEFALLLSSIYQEESDATDGIEANDIKDQFRDILEHIF